MIVFIIEKTILFVFFCIILHRLCILIQDTLPVSKIRLVPKYCDKYNIIIHHETPRQFEIIQDKTILDEIDEEVALRATVDDPGGVVGLFKGYTCEFSDSLKLKTITLCHNEFLYFPNNDLKWDSMCYYTIVPEHSKNAVIYPKSNSLYINTSKEKVTLKYRGNQNIPIILTREI